MTPIQATIVDVLGDDLAKLYKDQTRFLRTNDAKFVDLSAKADKLGKVDGAARSLMLARLYGLTGDREQVDYYLANARKLHADRTDHDLAQITALLALGYFSEATPIIRECGDPQRNLLNLFLNKPPASGLLHLMVEFYLKAKEMNLTNVPDFPPQYRDAIQIMNSWGDTDDDYVAALNIAGTVMRTRELMMADKGVLIGPVPTPLDGGPPYVKLGYRVDVDLETSIDMTCEFSERLAQSGVKIPQSMVFEFLPLNP
jgi:hypothetical protein